MDSSITEVPTFSDSTSLKMLEDITAKVWRTLPVISIPRSWILTYCVKYTEISEDVEKATIQCQYDGTDWDCTFIELVKAYNSRFVLVIYKKTSKICNANSDLYKHD